MIVYACMHKHFGERISYFSLTVHQPILQRKLRMPGLDGISHLVFLKTWDAVLGDTQNYFQCFRDFCVYLFFCAFHSLDSADKSVIYAVESAVIQWSHQIQGVLKRESSQPLLPGKNPTPTLELEFWKSR